MVLCLKSCNFAVLFSSNSFNGFRQDKIGDIVIYIFSR